MSTQVNEVGQRVADEYATHKVALGADAYGKWIAVSMSDGSSDHTLYDTKRDAVRHTDEQFTAYLQVTPATLSPEDAYAFLALARRMADAGMRMADPDHRAGGLDVIKRSTREDQRRQTAAILGRGKPSNITHDGRIY